MTEKDYKIVRSERSDDSYFYSHSDYTWTLVDKRTNKEIKSWGGSWNQGANYDNKTGATNVHLNGNFVFIDYVDQPTETISISDLIK
ncbi:hypothetical protein M0811_08657 [Anaeramoeba ignava]|uniref:Uncharacterized protein n=1 Tax=Anaeramoeba ignava TaxID=1746090 RepID=A0A9Q0LJB6_ANAIG|nr:hypothetical protein M0811_08657 [Anaeramoeba ignava]